MEIHCLATLGNFNSISCSESVTINVLGRGGNEFVSPVGAAMFTFSTLLSRSSQLGKNPSFAQHVFAVALVDAVSELSEVEVTFDSFLSNPP